MRLGKMSKKLKNIDVLAFEIKKLWLFKELMRPEEEKDRSFFSLKERKKENGREWKCL